MQSGGGEVVDSATEPRILVIPSLWKDERRLSAKLAFGVGAEFFDCLVHTCRVSDRWISQCLDKGELSDYDDPFDAGKIAAQQRDGRKRPTPVLKYPDDRAISL